MNIIPQKLIKIKEKLYFLPTAVRRYKVAPFVSSSRSSWNDCGGVNVASFVLKRKEKKISSCPKVIVKTTLARFPASLSPPAGFIAHRPVATSLMLMLMDLRFDSAD